MNTRLLIIALSLLLGACATQPAVVYPEQPTVPTKTKVVIPPYLLMNCAPLSLLKHPIYNQGETLDIISTWKREHDDCMQRFEKLRNITIKAFNIPVNEIPKNPLVR